MMKGYNSLVLNQASMCEAIQFWLNHVIPESTPQVSRVEQDKTHVAKVFTVEIESIEHPRNEATQK